VSALWRALLQHQSGPRIEETAMSDMRNKIVQIILDACSKRPPDLSDPGRAFLDSGMDSLDVTTVLMEAEEAFDIKIPDSDLNSIDSILSLEAYIGNYSGGGE
jgi:acyl carrier protein